MVALKWAYRFMLSGPNNIDHIFWKVSSVCLIESVYVPGLAKSWHNYHWQFPEVAGISVELWWVSAKISWAHVNKLMKSLTKDIFFNWRLIYLSRLSNCLVVPSPFLYFSLLFLADLFTLLDATHCQAHRTTRHFVCLKSRTYTIYFCVNTSLVDGGLGHV